VVYFPQRDLPEYQIFGQILPQRCTTRMEQRGQEQSRSLNLPSEGTVTTNRCTQSHLLSPEGFRRHCFRAKSLDTSSIVKAHNFHLSVETGKIRSRSRAFNPLPNQSAWYSAQNRFLLRERKRKIVFYSCLLSKLSSSAPSPAGQLQGDRSDISLRQEAGNSPGSPVQSSSASNSPPICLYAG